MAAPAEELHTISNTIREVPGGTLWSSVCVPTHSVFLSLAPSLPLPTAPFLRIPHHLGVVSACASVDFADINGGRIIERSSSPVRSRAEKRGKQPKAAALQNIRCWWIADMAKT